MPSGISCSKGEERGLDHVEADYIRSYNNIKESRVLMSSKSLSLLIVVFPLSR